MSADPAQIRQVLLNLVTNAGEAMSRGGTVSVTVDTVELDAGQGLERNLPAGRYVQLDVTDTGAGMTLDVAERALEPMFSTKPRGQATGLGLAVAYGIVANLAGAITIDSRPNQSTTVSVLLPVAEPGP